MKCLLVAVAAVLAAALVGSPKVPPAAVLAQEASSSAPGPLRLYFLNVGQGDAALLVTP
jgi:hypothetical protein